MIERIFYLLETWSDSKVASFAYKEMRRLRSPGISVSHTEAVPRFKSFKAKSHLYTLHDVGTNKKHEILIIFYCCPRAGCPLVPK